MTLMAGRCIFMPERLQKQLLEQLHSNHMGNVKARLLACKSIYWFNMNADIENTLKHCSAFLFNFNRCNLKISYFMRYTANMGSY